MKSDIRKNKNKIKKRKNIYYEKHSVRFVPAALRNNYRHPQKKHLRTTKGHQHSTSLYICIENQTIDQKDGEKKWGGGEKEKINIIIMVSDLFQVWNKDKRRSYLIQEKAGKKFFFDAKKVRERERRKKNTS